MPICRQWAYFDHASVAPLSAPAAEALSRYAHQSAQEGDTAWLEWQQGVERLRGGMADWIGAGRDELAFVPNTTAALSLVAEGFPWQPGDNVVLPGGEFPSNRFPWLHLARRGVEVRQLPSPAGPTTLDELRTACDRHTRMVALSWVQFATGYRLDLAAVTDIAHRQGAWVSLDAIQGLGAYQLDLSAIPIDCLAADGHKWLLGPEGAGVFYLRREHLDRLAPQSVGWNSIAAPGDYSRVEFRLRPDASRFEGGSLPMGNLLALGESVALLRRTSPAALEQRMLEVSDLAVERLRTAGAVVESNRGAAHRSAIIRFDLPGRDLKQVRQQALDARVALSLRVGRLRISPHAYTDEADLDRLIDAIRPRA